MEKPDKSDKYEGYEVGPIRPPSEARSLLIRVTRNCPWNRCKFCDLYQDTKFSIRKKEDIIKDIDAIKIWIDIFEETKNADIKQRNARINELRNTMEEELSWAYSAALSWYQNGMKSIFLQDSNSLVMKPVELIEVISHLKTLFPKTERITSYARSETASRISQEDMDQLAKAGLNRIHIGMESASDVVLKLIDKGTTKENHILAGKKVKAAGIELSEYFMPGLGGLEYSELNALETADALNQINPNYIRIRTLAVKPGSRLMEDYEAGIFTRTNDDKMIEELLLLVENLGDIQSTLVGSDHILNLLPEAEGYLPTEKEKIISKFRKYLDLPISEKIIYRVGRRTGAMNNLADLSDDEKRSYVEGLIDTYQIQENNIDQMIDDLMVRFI